MHITIPELSGPILINLSPGHRSFQAMNHFAWFCLHFSMSAVFLPHHMMTRAACSICWLPNVTLTVTQVGKAVETDLLCLRMCSDFLGFSSFIYQNTKPHFPKYPTDYVNIWGKIALPRVHVTQFKRHSGDYTLATPLGNAHFCRLIPSGEPDPNTRNSPWHTWPPQHMCIALFNEHRAAQLRSSAHQFHVSLALWIYPCPVLMHCWLCSKATPFFWWRIC